MKKIILSSLLVLLICVTVRGDAVTLQVQRGDLLMPINNPYAWELVVLMKTITDEDEIIDTYRTGIHPYPDGDYGTVQLPEWNEGGLKYVKVCWEYISTEDQFCGVVNDVAVFDGWYFLGGNYNLYLPNVYVN